MESLKDQFLLRPDIHFLNFGSFGATPKPIFQKYQDWQRVLEAEPVQFIAFDGYQYLADSRAALAKFLNCADKDDLVYVTNPSFAINMIAKSFPLEAGDEILTTDIEYGACDRTWNYYCTKKGATYRRQKINLPITTKEQFIEDFFKGYNEKTKAIFISHITSATGLILPAEEICAIAKEKGLITIVDGAHAPAHIPLDLSSIQADFYTGACHKWMMAPKGCSFLYATKSVQPICDPMIVSWGYQAAKPSHSKFLDYHQMIGTRDFSAFLTVATCIEFMEQHNWKSVGRQCHEMVLAHAPRFFSLMNSTPISPLNSEWIGQMISIPIQTPDPEKLQRTLFLDYKIEVPIMRQGDDVYLRYSINAFNTVENLDALYNAMKEIQKQGILLK
ncbi:MAG: aminotransferase class V-fold PLP-dependent enzyme [Sediminibacterium sp.]